MDTLTQQALAIATLDWKPSAALAKELSAIGFTIQAHQSIEALLGNTACSIFLTKQTNSKHAATVIHELHTQAIKRFPPPKVLMLVPGTLSTDALSNLLHPSVLLLEESVTDHQLLFALRQAAAEYQRVLNITRQSGETAFEGIVATSDAMRDIFETIEKVSAFNTTVLIRGESGTGKELVARAIHARSPRANKPFVALNCGAIPENLLESELFGHRKGAFTDASRDKRGLFEEANHGTILLDEIGELPIHLQVKLLRVLQEQAIQPVGATEPLAIDVRILAATLRDLESDVEEGRFRDDLFYRLNVVPISIPPLRERPSDIQALTQHFLVKHRSKLGLAVYEISPEVEQLLLNYPWPGNIRELENCLERAMILARGETIEKENLPDRIRKQATTSAQETLFGNIETDNLSIKQHTRNLEEVLIRKALAQTDGNRTHAAKLLEVSHRTLLYKLKEYELVD